VNCARHTNIVILEAGKKQDPRLPRYSSLIREEEKSSSIPRNERKGRVQLAEEGLRKLLGKESHYAKKGIIPATMKCLERAKVRGKTPLPLRLLKGWRVWTSGSGRGPGSRETYALRGYHLWVSTSDGKSRDQCLFKRSPNRSGHPFSELKI